MSITAVIRRGTSFPKFVIAALSTLGFCIAPLHLQGQESVFIGLEPALRRAVVELDADRLPDLDEAREEFAIRAQATEQFLRQAATDENYQDWIDFLRLDSVISKVDDEGSSSRELTQIATGLLERLVGTDPGLELIRLRELRTATRNLLAAVRYRDAGRSVKVWSQQLKRLADQIQSLDADKEENERTEFFASLNAVVGLLADGRQAEGVVQPILERFAFPNYRITVPERTVQTVVERSVDNCDAVRDCILGTRLFGSARLRGDVRADLRPSSGSARIRVQLVGTVDSQNTGYNGPVVLKTNSTGAVSLYRTLTIDGSGGVWSPVSGQASFSSQITSINHKLRVVRRIAGKRAADQKSQADAIARERMRGRVADQFSEQTSQTATSPPSRLIQPAIPYLQRLDLVLPTRVWDSTDQALTITGRMGTQTQLSSPTPVPPTSAAEEFAVQVHESAIENSISTVLAGRRFDRSEIRRILTALGVSPSDSGAADDKLAEDFEIVFSRFRPVIFEARKGVVRLGLRGSRFSGGGRTLDESLEVYAVYREIAESDGTVYLKRDNDIVIDIPRRRGISGSAIRSAVKDQFLRAFPETLLSRSFTVPPTFRLAALRGRVYQARRIDAVDGWLTIEAG